MMLKEKGGCDMQMDDIGSTFDVVEESSNAVNGTEETLQYSTVQEVEEPKDVNQYLEYMRQKREALERAATFEDFPASETETVVSDVTEDVDSTEQDSIKTDENVSNEENNIWLDNDTNEEGEKMKNKKNSVETDELRLDGNDSHEYSYQGSSLDEEASIEDLLAQAMKQDEIFLYQQKYIESLEERKRRVEALIATLEIERATIDTQIQAVQ